MKFAASLVTIACIGSASLALAAPAALDHNIIGNLVRRSNNGDSSSPTDPPSKKEPHTPIPWYNENPLPPQPTPTSESRDPYPIDAPFYNVLDEQINALKDRDQAGPQQTSSQATTSSPAQQATRNQGKKKGLGFKFWKKRE